MKEKSKIVTYIFITSLCLGLFVAGCAGRSPAVISPTALAEEPAVEVSLTVEVDEEESGVETATAVPMEIALTPTMEPTCTCAPQFVATKTVEATPVVITGGEKEEMINKVKADLASRLGVSEDEITVVSAEAKTWSDSSLGCPEEGVAYMQVLTPGYQIILEYDGIQYDYRTGDMGRILLCEK
ncbi:MAG: hypothetical protein R6U51_09845 [Anaerolineales bacterium]